MIQTPVLWHDRLDRELGFVARFKAEHLQHGRAFKYRGASNAVSLLMDRGPVGAVATHSSGNHALALALAATRRGLAAHIVMPQNAPPHKIQAVSDAGGRVIRCPPTLDDREATLKRIVEETVAGFIHPYNDPDVIAGQGTCVLEWLEQSPELDLIIAPVGGGGLLSGALLATERSAGRLEIWGAEPALADDAARSMETGSLQRINRSDTIADGLRTSLGTLPFAVFQTHQVAIHRVREDDIHPAMEWFNDRFDQPIEPSAAVAVALMLSKRRELAGRHVGIIISGGNVG
ncbi:MAG: pyridoxal-phosphate dependent enzyme [Phycisphaeraceae bacterium]|nr:pyridoxal-phosphate dependent enzyme [Phycisphaeraceae bacterium]